MKIFRYILLTSLTCTLFSCGPDELIPEPVPPVVNPGDKDEPGEEPEQPEEPAKIQLAITASLQNMQQTRGIIEAFAPGHEMGVFISTGRTDKPAGTKLIAIFRKCIISLYFGIEGGIPHFRQRCYPGTVLKAGGYIFNRPAILKDITGYSSNMGLPESSPEKSRLYAFCE